MARALKAVGVSIAILIVSELAFSVLLLPLAAAAQGVLCIDIADESYPMEERITFSTYGCGSEDDFKALLGSVSGVNGRFRFGFWYVMMHAVFLGVNEGTTFLNFHDMANSVGHDGEGLLHLKMCAAYLGKIWFAGWLMLVLVFAWKQRGDIQAGMRAPKAVCVSIVLLIISCLAFSILLLPLAAAAKSTFCTGMAGEDSEDGQKWVARFGCGSEDDVDLGDENRAGFGYWFTILHAELLGVSDGTFAWKQRIVNLESGDGEGLLHIKMCAAYLGKIWFAGWIAVVLFAILPRVSVLQAENANHPPCETVGAGQTEAL